jgi:TPR repeat protein
MNVHSNASLLPPLYFQDKVEGSSADSTNDSTGLPFELLHRCLTEYASWGDLAKLACVQKSWSGIMYDAAASSQQAKWELALGLESGTNGLLPNPSKAMQLYMELSNVCLLPSSECENTESSFSVRQFDASNECFAPAMKRLAYCYLTGNGIATAVDSKTGLAWLQASHVHGQDADAAHEVALVYEYGTYGIEIDVVKAADWFRLAAEADHMEAMAELGLCYELGCGVEQSDQQALDWYIAAAEKGHLTAKYSVGEAYEEARGVPQSDEEACLWYYKAALAGDEDSRKALRRLEDIARIVVPGAGVLLDG